MADVKNITEEGMGWSFYEEQYCKHHNVCIRVEPWAVDWAGLYEARHIAILLGEYHQGMASAAMKVQAMQLKV